MKKYKSVIERVAINDATFKNSPSNTFEPTYINFFYGNNGTGKSTITRSMKALSGLTWTAGKNPRDYALRVFSRDFIADELKFEDDDPTMPGVITLGEEYVEAQDQVDSKTAEKSKLIEEITIAETRLQSTNKESSDLVQKYWDIFWNLKGREYKSHFGGSGDLRSKENFFKRVKSTVPQEHNLNEIKARFDTASDANARRYDILPKLDLSKLESIENYHLLCEPITSTADGHFSRVMQSIDATGWVKIGVENYLDRTDGNCPFCQQPLNEIANQIAECFDSKYNEDCAKLIKYQQQYIGYFAEFVSVINGHVSFIKNTSGAFGNVSEYEKNLAQLEKIVSENNQLIASKVAKPSETIWIESTRQSLSALNDLIDESNALIIKNNEICDNKSTEKTRCLNAAWELAAFDLQPTIQQFTVRSKELESSIKTQRDDLSKQNMSLKSINNELAVLTEKLGGSSTILQKVNVLLEKTGFRGFSLKPHDTVPDRYQIVRDDGSIARRLSEGERNFIAFLYFYYLVQGAWFKEDLLKKKIVVIDDPISSMDSGVLAIVGSLVRELIEDCFYDGEKHRISQIFTLTHNPYFHNSISQKMLRPDEHYYKKVAFFEVKKDDDNISTISAPCIQPNLTKDQDIKNENVSPVQNSYTALWEDYKTARRESTLLNVIHRIIETHFILLCSFERDYLRDAVLEEAIGDPRMERLVKEVLQNIHDSTVLEDSIGEMVYFPAPNSVADYKEAFRLVFTVMGQEQHYAKMSGEGNLTA